LIEAPSFRGDDDRAARRAVLSASNPESRDSQMCNSTSEFALIARPGMAAAMLPDCFRRAMS
jgi:hypothetical protein